MCLSSLVFFLPSHFRLIYPTFPPYSSPISAFSCARMCKTTSLAIFPQSFLVLVFDLIYFSRPSLLPLALSSSLRVLYSISKPSAIAFALQVIRNLFLIWILHAATLYSSSSILPPSVIAPAFPFGLYSHCLSWLLFPWISYLPPFCPLFVPSLPNGISSSSSQSVSVYWNSVLNHQLGSSLIT